MSEIVVSTIMETCEARVGIVKGRKSNFHHCGVPAETSRKQFSAPGGCCEARAGLFNCGKGPR